VHVDPVMLRLLLHSRGERGVILTSDRVAPAADNSHSSDLSGELMHGGRLDRGAIRSRDGTLAGSNITILEGVRLMRDVAGLEWRGAAATTASNPAAVLALRDRARLRLRARADLLLLDSRMNLKAVFVGGRNYN
jgi:N-acetylglucosamine-6-phosphate deacetylase